MKNKIFDSFKEAVADISDGATIMMFCWGGLGRATPQNLIRAVYDKGVKDLTIISHNFGPPRFGTYLLSLEEVCTPFLLAERIKKLVTAMAPLPAEGNESISILEKKMEAGEVELELMSHGTLAHRIRAGAAGLGGFYTPVGVGTIVSKELKEMEL